MSVWFCILSVVAVSAPQFEARQAGGGAVVGALVELSADRVVLQTESGSKTLATGQLLELTQRSATAPAAEPAAWVELIDGSALAARDYQVSNRQAIITLLDGTALTISSRSIASVRFHRLRGDSDQQWTDILKAEHTGDTIVVRKEDTIDHLGGVLGDVTADTVQFELDGEPVPVKRRKVEGLIYARTGGDPLPAALCTLVDTGGTRLEATSVKVNGNSAHIKTPAGGNLDWPLAHVERIDFKVQYLSDLEPESIARTPFFGSADRQSASSRLFFRPRLNPPTETQPLRVNGKTFAKGLTLHGGTEVVFRLPGKFRTLHALAGIEDAVRPEGNVKLRIVGDDRVLLEAEITGKQKQPLPIDVSLAGVKRLKIVVDFNGDEVGDQLDFCEARLLP